MLIRSSTRRHAERGELFAEHGVEAEVVDAAPAVLFRHHEPEEPGSPGCLPRRPVDRSFLAVSLDAGADLTVDERPDGGAELVVVGVEDGAARRRPRVSTAINEP